ncbi:MAG: serine hydrolase [Planctomycetes bacterium]|nr:serine hydrolase [Planctomycetota bacterium]
MLLATALLSVPLPQGPLDLEALLRADERCAPIVAKAREHRLQVLVAVPVVGDDGEVTLRRSHFGDAERYFYPASSIKLCGAVAVLQHLAAHNREHGTALGLDSELVIEPRFDGDRRVDGDDSNWHGGALTVRHALRKMLLVSDNQAYNHCFDLCGPDGLNRAMWAAGLSSTRLWHRLSEARTRAENEQTRAVRVGGVTFAARDAAVELSNQRFADLELGLGYLSGNLHVDGQMSFAHKNAISLVDLQDLLVEVVRPEIDTGKRGFPALGVADRLFLVRTLGELPRESRNPRYPDVADHACKFVWRGVSKVIPPEHLRVYDKIGRAYGFSTENAYIEDRRTGAGFFLAVVVYTNPDGILNDDRYAYAEIAEPFLDAVGEIVARAVFARKAR